MRIYRKTMFCFFIMIMIVSVNNSAMNTKCLNDNTVQCVNSNTNIYFFSVSKVLQTIEYENNETHFIVKGITIIIGLPGSLPIVETGEHEIHLLNYTTLGIVNNYFIMGLIIDHFPLV